jgi:hypothetical protein
MSNPYGAHSADPQAASLPADGSDQPTSLEQQGQQDPAPHAEPEQPKSPDGGTPEPEQDEKADEAKESEQTDPSLTPEPGVTQVPDNTVDPKVYESKEYLETHGHNPQDQNRGDY